MTCKDCPEPAERPAVDPPPKRPVTSQGWVVYTGGPEKIHLASLTHVIPDIYDRVTVDADGLIVYANRPDDWEPPSPIDGYTQDGRVFTPQWKSCIWRAYSVLVKPVCNCLDVIAQCNNPQADTFCEMVKCAVCDQCVDRVAIPGPRPRPKRKTL